MGMEAHRVGQSEPAVRLHPTSDQTQQQNNAAPETSSVVAASEHMGSFDPRKTLNPDADIIIDVKNADFYYGKKQALYKVSLPLRTRQVTALIGPSGCGKSTF